MLRNFRRGRSFVPVIDWWGSCITISTQLGFETHTENYCVHKELEGVKRRRRGGRRRRKRWRGWAGGRKSKRRHFKEKEQFEQGMEKDYHGVCVIA